MDINVLLAKIREQYTAILADNLVGIYVHGSIALGCFNPKISDVDFIVVVKSEPTLEQKSALIRVVHELDAQCPPKGLEMSAVLLENCRIFRHPTPFVLHFSNAYKARSMADVDAYCRSMHGEDGDLAAHFTIIRAAGIVLYGVPIEDVFAPVPKTDYIDSIYGDICDAETDIYNDFVYITLNLCRVLAYLKNDLVLSKAQGGAWGLEKLPKIWHSTVSAALDAYTDAYTAEAPEQAGKFAKYMLSQIKFYMKIPEEQ